MDERLLRSERLTRRGDFQRCYRTGRRRRGSLLTLHISPNPLKHPRLGVTASRKVGNAVVRHRVRRRIREIYRRWDLRPSLPAVDVVVHVHPQTADAAFDELKLELLRLLRPLARCPK